jgi:hypothetical protein
MAGTKKDAEEFVRRWRGCGNEEQDKHKYWIGLFQDVLGLDDALDRLEFEQPVVNSSGSKSPGFIDVLIPTAKAIVEQKGVGVDLDKAELRQGSMVTPAQQALRYAQGLPLSAQPRYVIACNFQEIRVYDRDTDPLCTSPLFDLALEDLPKNLAALDFLRGRGEAPASLQQAVSVKAGQIMGEVHNLLAAQFHDPDSPESHHALSVLCTRLMFLMYCEDAGLIAPAAFRDYLQHYHAEDLRHALKDLFEWLDTPDAERDEYAEGPITAFPYMDGGLFHERVEVPPVTETIRTELIVQGCQEFDWSNVDPTVFGSIFEGALSHDARRSGGMHYTSPENIHRVIDPLFLDGLKTELADAMARPEAGGARTRALRAFQDRIGSLTFLDPACGSGNFLTETYKCLRRLENKVLFELSKGGETTFVFEDVEDSPVKVTLEHFHGIEINDYACCVARTALWIAEKQADADTRSIVLRLYDELPLTDYAGIVEGNALRMDWNDVVPASECDYVMGNPPFIGARNQSEGQKQELLDVFDDSKNAGNIDYCGAWYITAARYTKGTHVRCALVSTNSICQGEQVANVWSPLHDLGIHIDFAHTTFRWDNQADDKAHVFCVIVGFSRENVTKELFVHKTPDSPGEPVTPKNINAYLKDAPDVFVWSRPRPLCDVPEMGIGNKPIDDGNYLFTDEEKDEFLAHEPGAGRFFHPWIGSKEFLHGYTRWCLWLGDTTWSDLKDLPLCRERVENVRQYRLASKSAGTRKIADKPTRFHVENMPKGTSVIIPEVSSERRRYIPMGFIGPETFCSNLVRLVPGASLYHLGILSSQFHNAWMRTVAGRLKSDYRYSAGVVYNTFVWPECDDASRDEVAGCAQAMLDARGLYDEATLADLYDPRNATYFPELMEAHKALDKAVEGAYGVDYGDDEEKIVAHLFELYAGKTSTGA